MSEIVAPPVERVTGIDAYRGAVMFLMLAEVLKLDQVAEALPENRLWQFLAYHQAHVEWRGCSLHDLIQPSFSFLVGVALPFSLAGRTLRGQSRLAMIVHAAWRALLLTALGVFLRSQGREQTNFTFEDTLSQIGLGYLPLFFLALTTMRWQWTALGLILLGYWGAFVGYPAPGPDFNYPAVGVPAEWTHHAEGLAAHFNKNSNLAWAFDVWFLNIFPRATPFAFNGGGYSTLSFVPTLGTMILGLIVGGWLRADVNGPAKIGRLVALGVGCLLVGALADRLGICPSVKRIWTPAWVLVSGGWCCGLLAAFFGVCDVLRLRAWAVPLVAIGANSIAAYVMAHCLEGYIMDNLRIHFGQRWGQILGTPFAPLVEGAVVLTLLFAVLLWMYRRRIFLKI